jgi:UDP-N-acetylmuramate dehydrogenase
MKVFPNYSLLHLNTFGIDTSALYFSEIDTEEGFLEMLEEKKYKDIPKLILGGGSNLLFTKAKLEYLVLKNNIPGIRKIREDQDHVYICAGAGENWHGLVQYCIAHNYGGIENLSLIPGNTGAGPMQNIGAYGVELKDTFYELEALHIHDKRKDIFNAEQCRFGYRESVFKKELKGQYIITSVTLRLDKKPKFNTAYGAIGQELDKMGIKELSLEAIGKAVCNIRTSKLPDPAQIGNAGSFFKNPEITVQKFQTLLTRFPSMVNYPLANGNVKLAAGWLIEQCGWKGKSAGNAGVHSLQALVLVNNGKARGEEIYNLSQQVLDSVQEKFDILLEREVNII